MTSQRVPPLMTFHLWRWRFRRHYLTSAGPLHRCSWRTGNLTQLTFTSSRSLTSACRSSCTLATMTRVVFEGGCWSDWARGGVARAPACRGLNILHRREEKEEIGQRMELAACISPTQRSSLCVEHSVPIVAACSAVVCAGHRESLWRHAPSLLVLDMCKSLGVETEKLTLRPNSRR